MTIVIAELSPASVSARFDWARRNGHANWVWPDVRMESWRTAMEAIGQVARKVLAGGSDVAFFCGDAAAASVAGYTSGMGPLLGHWIECGRVRTSPAMAETFALHLLHNRDRMVGLSQAAKEIVAQLARIGISPLVIKGMHTAYRYFPEPGARASSDIDLVIPMDAMPATEEMFAKAGFRRIPRFGSPYACDWVAPSVPCDPRTLMYVHRDDPWSIDVQASLNRRLLTGKQVRLDAIYRPIMTEEWSLASQARVLAQPLLALQLAAHISQILLSVTLVRVVELISVIRADVAAGKLVWSEFLDGAEVIGGARYIYPALIFCEQLAPGTVPPDVLMACAADAPKNLRHLMRDISVDHAQSLGRHSVRERFMWAGNWSERLRQVAGEFAMDGRQQPFGRTLYSIGTKLWTLRRGRYTA
jgi:hypothetical protein